VLHLSMLTSVLDGYTDFSALGPAALAMVAEQRNTIVTCCETPEYGRRARRT
jgi:hypothetical protein